MSKLILTNEVAGLGSAGDVIEVKDGYARNYLIPQGFAVAWSRGGEKQVVFVDLGDGRWQPVRIVPGVRAGGLVELREGPAAGAKVAKGGVFLIASESRLKSGMDKW